MKNICLLIAFLAAVVLIPLTSAWSVEETSGDGSSPEPRPGTAKSVDPTQVVINVEHGIELPWGKPGFRVTVSKWAPHADISVIAVGPDGEEIELVPVESPLKADGNGEIIIDIDYERKGLRQGLWILAVVGKPGFHIVPVKLPLVEPPTDEGDSWKLLFGEESESQ